MTKSRAAEPDARRAYHRLSMQGRGPARPKPRPQANTLNAYLRPAPQPPVELAPLLQQMKTLFSVQPVSDVGSQPVSSPPVSSPPTFNPLDNSNAVSRVRTRTARRKFLGRSERPYRQRRLLAGGCATLAGGCATRLASCAPRPRRAVAGSRWPVGDEDEPFSRDDAETGSAGCRLVPRDARTRSRGWSRRRRRRRRRRR
jgi:hypothetical protein